MKERMFFLKKRECHLFLPSLTDGISLCSSPFHLLHSDIWLDNEEWVRGGERRGNTSSKSKKTISVSNLKVERHKNKKNRRGKESNKMEAEKQKDKRQLTQETSKHWILIWPWESPGATWHELQDDWELETLRICESACVPVGMRRLVESLFTTQLDPYTPLFHLKTNSCPFPRRRRQKLTLETVNQRDSRVGALGWRAGIMNWKPGEFNENSHIEFWDSLTPRLHSFR